MKDDYFFVSSGLTDLFNCHQACMHAVSEVASF